MFVWEYSNYSKINNDVRDCFPFKEARKDQLETVSEILEAIEKGYKYIVLEAGTGTGKSAIAATLTEIFDSSYVFTVTKQLQDQYLQDFNDLGVKLVKGRSNFKCKKYADDGEDYNCDEGKCVIEGYSCEYSLNRPHNQLTKENTCNYYCQKWIALNSKTVISNYPYLFLELNYVDDFSNRSLMVFDESHKLESTLMNILKLEFKLSDLKEYLGLEISQETINRLNKSNFNSWIDFIEKIRDKYSEELNKIKDIKNKPELKHKIAFIKKEISDCNRFIDNILKDPKIWIFDYDHKYNSIVFKPLKVDNYAKETLFDFADVCLFMSATILDYRVFGTWLGIDSSEIYPIRRKSPFDIQRNPIKTFNKVSLSNKVIKKNAPKTIDSLKLVLEWHKHEKGIIHTVSGKCKEFIMKNLDNPRLITHDTENRAEQLEKFKKSNEPLVFVSPSMNEGVDLPGDLCRFQVMYKIPYPNLKDKQTFMRNEIDDKWYSYKTAMTLVQTHGRGMRYEQDYCKTYFIDNRIDGFIKKDINSNNFLPQQFRDAINATPVKIENDNDDYFANETHLQKINRKYRLTMRANQFLEEKKYKLAIDFYKSLINHELFINDYHPFRKLARAYHGDGSYDKEAEIIAEFLKSGRYCNKNRLNWFIRKLEELSERGYYDKSEIPKLIEEFNKKGALNKVLSSEPVVTAYEIKRNKRINQMSENSNYPPEYFDSICKMDPDLDYDGQVAFKYELYVYGNELIDGKKYNEAIGFYNRLLFHELFINDYHPYRKLARVYRLNNQYDDATSTIIEFFQSGRYCNRKQLNWFVNQLNDLGKYGNFDLSLLDELLEEFYEDGALNKKKANKPVPNAFRLLKLTQTKINHKKSNNYLKNYYSSLNNKSDSQIRNKSSIYNDSNNRSVVGKRMVNYNSDYFNSQAEEISKKFDFISDEELLNHQLKDVNSIYENYDKIKEKYELINEGKELEKIDFNEAIEFYENLKANPLFIHDYYPYKKQCILFREQDGKGIDEWNVIVEVFSSEIYCNPYHLIWFNNRVSDLIEELDLEKFEILKLRKLFEEYDKYENDYKKLQLSSIPIAERILEWGDEIKLLSEIRFNYLQRIFYKKELGDGLIRRKEYKSAIQYLVELLSNKSLNYQYYAYKQLARIYNCIDDKDYFKKVYMESLKYFGLK